MGIDVFENFQRCEYKEKYMQDKAYYIAICDDEESDRKHIEEMTKEVCIHEQINSKIICFASAGQLLNEIDKGTRFDLLMIDIMMPVQNGMELARQLRKSKLETSIVFISNNRDMALQGYEVSAARYLAKPIQEKLLLDAVRFCYEQYRRKGGFLIPFGRGTRRVFPEEIYYIEINGRKGRIIQKDEEWDTGLTMSELENIFFDQGFIRCHQSFLVNCRYIRTFFTTEVELTNGKRIPISKHRIREIRKLYFDYMIR